MSFMSAQRPDVLIANIAVALHDSNIFSFFISYTYFAGQVKGRVEGEPSTTSHPYEAEIHEH